MAHINLAQLSASLPLRGNIALTRLSLVHAQRASSALAAVEQLLRVPVPDDSEADNGNMRHVWREDLCALIGLIAENMQQRCGEALETAKTAEEQAQEARS